MGKKKREDKRKNGYLHQKQEKQIWCNASCEEAIEV